MDEQLRNKVFTTLEADGTLTALGDVYVWRLPFTPENLEAKLGIIIGEAGAPDSPRRHGAAVDPHVEIKILGWGTGSAEPARQAATRIDELLLKGFTFADGSVARKWRPMTGWQNVDEQQAELLHMQNVYVTRYWSRGRITAVTN